MTNKSFISFFFGLVLLAAIGIQLIDEMQNWNIAEDQIELSESTDSLEEDSLEKLYWLSECAFLAPVNTMQQLPNVGFIPCVCRTVYLKVPSPPPDLA